MFVFASQLGGGHSITVVHYFTAIPRATLRGTKGRLGRLERAERGSVEEQRGAAASQRGKISLLPCGGQLAERQEHRSVRTGKALQVVLELALI